MRDQDLRPDGTMRTAGAPESGRGDHHSGDVRQIISGDGGSALRAGGAWIDGGVPSAGITECPAGIVSGGGERASGAGGADGGVIRAVGRGESFTGPDFQITPPAGGYAWWYVDALSDDGAYGITLIAFLGSVFPPYYAWSRRRGGGDPLRHCALNVALYGKAKRWAMTERGAASLDRGTDYLAIGPSALSWDGSGLTIRIEEIAVPLPRRIRGTIKLYPSAVETRVRLLDTAGRHR